MNRRKFTLFAVAAAIIMVVEWQVATGWGRAMSAHYWHGLCNTGVGWPYTHLVHELRTISDSGDSARLNRALRAADEHSRDIFDVWLQKKTTAYKSSVDEILR